MPEQFEVKKPCEPIENDDFYRFISAHYFHHDNLSWGRTQILFAIEAGVLVAAFNKRGWLAIAALVLGSLLVFLIWRLIQRDWQVRDQYLKYFDEFHKPWEVMLRTRPKSKWYSGRHIVEFVTFSIIVFNLCSAVIFAFELYCKFKDVMSWL
ncbi:MAG: hypothetical protein ACRD59_03815 [Candidatus Acidiferrales bacterium]